MESQSLARRHLGKDHLTYSYSLFQIPLQKPQTKV